MPKRGLLIFVLTFIFCLTATSFAQRSRDRYRDRDRDEDPFPRRGACFFVDNNFQGNYFCVRAGEGLEHMPTGFNDRISSIRIFGNARVSVFKDSKFRGRRLDFNRSIRDLVRIRNENDSISSIRVR